jgi:hypothetical protein
MLLGDMPRKSDPKPKLTDAERHKRFVEMAKEVGASDKPGDFDWAFDMVAGKKKGKTP